MKPIINILLFTTLLLSVSCEKEDFYADGGVAHTNINQDDEFYSSPLNGTTWVLTYLNKGFVTEYPNDTIKFNNLFYSINGKENTDSYVYRLTRIMDLGNPYNLVLYGFSPFGDNGIWSANIINTFIADSVINLTEFSNSSDGVSKIKATFVRIDN